jgi:hypothetical protein
LGKFLAAFAKISFFILFFFFLASHWLAGTMRDHYYAGTCNDSASGHSSTNCTIWNVSGTSILTINNIDDSSEVEKAAYSAHTIITFLEAIFICFWYRRMYIHVCGRWMDNFVFVCLFNCFFSTL